MRAFLLRIVLAILWLAIPAPVHAQAAAETPLPTAAPEVAAPASSTPQVAPPSSAPEVATPPTSAPEISTPVLPAPEVAAPAPSAPSPRVREVGPATYYVKDETGELVPVLNLSLAELHRLLQLDLQQGVAIARPPAYAFQELTIDGTANGRQAELSVKASIRLLSEEFIRVPLQLGRAVMREAPTCEEGDVFLTCENTANGYVAWLRGAADQLCHVTLNLLVPIEQVGNEWRLDLQAPRSTSSQLSLTVPVPAATAVVTAGVLQIHQAESDSRFVVTGLGGDFRIAWRRANPQAVSPRPLLEATIEHLVKIDGVRQVTADVRMKVSSLRGEFDAFTVRIPSGARLFPRQFNQSGLQITELAAAAPGEARLVQVKLDRSTAAPVEVQLLMEYMQASNGRTAEYDLSGFEVEDAIRQSGTMDFVVKGDLSLTWKPAAGAQRTFVPEALRQKVFARFELTRRSYGLRFQVTTKETQVSVEPTYVLHVYNRRVQLDATLKYRVRGTNLYGLSVNLPGWHVTQVGPDSLLDVEALDRSRVEPLFVPLAPAAILQGGEFALQVTAIQELADPAAGLSVILPRPDARGLAPATVVIQPADNVELTISDERSRGLERDPFPPPLDLPEGQQRPLFYREINDAAASTLVADVQLRQQSVSISGSAEIRLDARAARVEQRFQYRVAYEPLRHLQFVMPRSLLESGDVRFVCEQLALPVVEMPSAAGSNRADGLVQVQVDPLNELLGLHEVVVQHSRLLSNLEPGQETGIEIALVQPHLGEGAFVTANTLRIHNSPAVSFRLDDSRWEQTGIDEASPDVDQLSLSADSLPPEVTLQISRRDVRRQASTVVLQSWIETRLGASLRRERAAFRFATDQDQVAVRLPEGARLERLGLGGREVTNYVVRDQRTHVVDVTPGAEQLLEIWYEAPRRGGPLTRTELEVPQVVDAQSQQRVFWTLATAPDVHLLLPPDEVTPLLNWTWQGLYWRRTPRMVPREIERLIGATPQASEIPETANVYLFSSFGPVGRLSFSLATRGAILGAMSGSALALGLLLIYVRRLRHPAALFVGGLVLFTAILWRPELALALLQASLFGLVLVLIACGLKWYVDRRQARKPVIQGTIYANPDSQTIKASGLFENRSPPGSSTAPVTMAIAESKV